MRQNFLTKRGDLFSDLHEINKEAAIKQIIQHEKSKKAHNNIKLSLGKKSSHSISKILVPEGMGHSKESYEFLKNERKDIISWHEIEDPQEVEDHMLD